MDIPQEDFDVPFSYLDIQLDQKNAGHFELFDSELVDTVCQLIVENDL